MKICSNKLSALSCLVALTICAECGETAPDDYADIPDNEPVVHHLQTGELDADGWCQAKPTRGNFTISLPGKYHDSLIKLPSKTGGSGIMHTVLTTTPDGIEFAALQTEIIGERPDSTAANSVIERMEKIATKIEKEEVEIGDLPATRLTITAKGVIGEFALITTENSEYMLVIQAGPDIAKKPGHAADVRRFFESFKVHDIE